MSSIHKTKAKKTTVDGIEFGSAAEARRYSELRLMEKSGEIFFLQLQPRFRIFDEGGVTLHYTADFRYYRDKLEGTGVVEEVKGMADTAYLMRRKMFLGLHPTLPLYEIRGKKRLRVYLTPGGICRTKDETKPRTPRPRAARKEAK